MKPCATSWCTAMTEGRFCVVHEQNPGLHPEELDEEDIEDEEDDDHGDDYDDD